MSVRQAKSAGFCFGVSRAVKMTRDLAEQGRRVATLGPLIHNPQCVAELERMDVVTAKVANATMRPMVTSTQRLGAPEQMMIEAPVTKTMSPVPRSGCSKMSRNGTVRIPQSLT